MQQEVAVVLRPQQGLEDTVNLGVDRVAHEGSLAGSRAPASLGPWLGSPGLAAGRPMQTFTIPARQRGHIGFLEHRGPLQNPALSLGMGGALPRLDRASPGRGGCRAS